jgi:hypothetical protein
MVKSQRRQFAFLALLAGIGLFLLYWNLRSQPAAAAPGGAKASEPAALDDVAPIGLDRLAHLGADDNGEADDLGTFGAGERTAAVTPALARSTPLPTTSEPAAPTPPPEPTPPPMNLRFIGAVEVRSGVWVASLLTDRKDLLLGKEGEIIGNRYRIVKIGFTSIDLMETTTGQQQRVRLGGS